MSSASAAAASKHAKKSRRDLREKTLFFRALPLNVQKCTCGYCEQHSFDGTPHFALPFFACMLCRPLRSLAAAAVEMEHRKQQRRAYAIANIRESYRDFTASWHGGGTSSLAIIAPKAMYAWEKQQYLWPNN